jgi:hypothetical protein
MTSQQLRRNDWPDTEALFRLLGIDFAAEGDKAPPFAPVFKSLGLQFDLKDVDKGFFSLGHTTSRRQELLEQIGAMLSDGNALVNPKEFELLHGRLVWFNSFVFGRTLKAAVRCLQILQGKHFESDSRGRLEGRFGCSPGGACKR